MVERIKGKDARPNRNGKFGISRRESLRLTIGVKFVRLVTIKTSRDALLQQVLSNNLAQADLAADFKIFLPILKGILEGQGGKIWVESQEGKDSRFSFSIPVSTSENEGNIIQNSGGLL